jgi:DNA-binding HxlR family transcriptional regulator
MSVALKILGGKWKIRIINSLIDGKRRYSELRKLIPDVSEKMLSQELKDLEKNKIVDRKFHPTVPPMVEYSLTEHGKSVKSLIGTLNDWGTNHQQLIERMK